MKTKNRTFNFFTGFCILSAGLLFSIAADAAKPIAVYGLSCEHLVDPVGIDTKLPRLSWVLESGQRDQLQTAYQVLVASSPDLLNPKKADLWNSGKVESGQSVLLEYGGKSLASRDRCWWKVRVWDKNGKASDWSETGYFELGLLDPGEWKASWIRSARERDEVEETSPMFRKEFKLSRELSSARLYISSLGCYEAEINGEKVGDQVLTPGYTSFPSRVQYQTFDVTDKLRNGDNAMGITLGNGWYRVYLDWWIRGAIKQPKYLSLIAQVEVTYKDGSREVFVSNDDWKSSSGPVRSSSMYGGETYDARLEKTGWSKPGFDDSNWTGTLAANQDKNLLVAPASPPIRTIEEIVPLEIFVTPSGDTVVDMGQNMVGWIRLKVRAAKGTTITLRHAEVLDREGNFYTENLRKAAQTNRYICKGEGSETWEPRFTFQGFRYVAVSGFPGPVEKDMITGVVVHSDMKVTGYFSCNNNIVNQLQHNIVWGQKGNFLDVPTDCPQRDERLGWTGDAQVFAPTAIFNMDCAGFYTKWLADLALDQRDNGSVPWVVPDELGGDGAHGWGDAATVIPWAVYRYYGDVRILQEQYPSMKAWVDYQAKQAGDAYIWDPKGGHFGDWLAFATNRSDYPGATTDKDLLATAYFYHSTNLLQRTARVLGKNEEAAGYSELMAKIRSAFQREFLTPNGRLSSNTQTAYVVALSFGLIPEELEEVAAKRLAEDVNRFKHLTTGFLGTPDLCHVLTRYGYLDEAYMLLFRKEYPSWLYPVTQGATTIWERWDGQKPDGSFQDPGMNSFNHYAYGAIGDWLYKKVAGIDLEDGDPGYKSILIKPHPGSGMNNVKALHQTPYGTLASAWNIVDGKMVMTVTIPVNTRASIFVPSEGSELIIDGKPVKVSREEKGPGYSYLVVEKGSGTYVFESAIDL